MGIFVVVVLVSLLFFVAYWKMYQDGFSPDSGAIPSPLEPIWKTGCIELTPDHHLCFKPFVNKTTLSVGVLLESGFDH